MTIPDPVPAGEVEALRKAIEFCCMTVAFIGRDQHSDRINDTLDGLCKLALDLDPKLRVVLARLSEPPARPETDETARLRERVADLEGRLVDRDETSLAGLMSDIAREIESHDQFDCPAGTTYVKAAEAIATHLVEKFGRARSHLGGHPHGE